MFIVDYKINKALYDVRDYLLSSWLIELEESGFNITKHKMTLAKNAVGCFVLNAFNSYYRNRGSCYVSLNRNTYTKPRIINGKRTRRKVSYLYIKKLISYLEAQGYIEVVLGEVNKFGYDKLSGKLSIEEATPTRLRFTDTLLQLF